MIFLLNKETRQRLKAVKRLISVIKNFIGWLKYKIYLLDDYNIRI